MNDVTKVANNLGTLVMNIMDLTVGSADYYSNSASSDFGQYMNSMKAVMASFTATSYNQANQSFNCPQGNEILMNILKFSMNPNFPLSSTRGHSKSDSNVQFKCGKVWK